MLKSQKGTGLKNSGTIESCILYTHTNDNRLSNILSQIGYQYTFYFLESSLFLQITLYLHYTLNNIFLLGLALVWNHVYKVTFTVENLVVYGKCLLSIHTTQIFANNNKSDPRHAEHYALLFSIYGLDSNIMLCFFRRTHNIQKKRKELVPSGYRILDE